MPTPTTAQRYKVNVDPVADAHILLVEFQEDGNPTIHRVANNNEDVTHNGQTYTGLPIEIHLPHSSDEENSVRLSVSNITRTLGAAVARTRNRIGCRIKMIDISLPNVAIIDTLDLFVIKNVTGNSTRISGELGLRASLSMPVPFQRTSRIFFPGVWLTK